MDVNEMAKEWVEAKKRERKEKENGVTDHESICKELNNIYKTKNADYGNSFSESYQEWGITSAVVRMDDKMRRLKQLAKHDAQVKDERMEDTLLDLANYAIMTLGELRKESNSID